MDPEHCPKCNKATVITGWVPHKAFLPQTFEPAGMRFFNFRSSGSAPSCTSDFRACCACGLVWSQLSPVELRAFIDEHGNAETKLKLSGFRKGPPEQELA